MQFKKSVEMKRIFVGMTALGLSLSLPITGFANEGNRGVIDLSSIQVETVLEQFNLEFAEIEETISVSNYNELVSAIENANESVEIVILDDIVLEDVITIKSGLSVTLSGNGTLFAANQKKHFVASGRVAFTLTDNVILDGQSYGGGLNFTEIGTIITLEGGTIQNCNQIYSQTVYGAAIQIYNSTLIINGTTIINNGNRSRGGGVAASNSQITMNGGVITNNTANWGAGIHLTNNSKLVMNGGEISNNTADNGAAIEAYISDLEINGGIIEGNTASIDGGAITSLGGQNQITINGGAIINNTSVNGGAFSLSSGQIIVNDGEISGNTATVDGGGFFIEPSSPTELTINGGEIKNNIAGNDGGGIWTDALENLEIRNDAIVADNSASQAYYIEDADDIALHNQQIDSTVTWTAGFEYIYNNNDVAYTKGTTNTHTITVITRYLDEILPEDTKTYQVADGAAFFENFEVLDGYKLHGASIQRQLTYIDVDNKTISIDSVHSDYTIELRFGRIE